MQQLSSQPAQAIQDEPIGLIHELIEARDFGRLKAALCSMEIHDLAELLRDYPDSDETAIAFRMLPKAVAAEILGEFEFSRQETLLEQLNSQRVAEIINEMPPDDRTELLEELPSEFAQKLLAQLRGDELKIARSLLAYPEESIGRLMTPEYIAVRQQWAIQHVLEHIRKVAPTRETAWVVYVVDDNWRLLDELYLEDIVMAEPDQIVAELMDGQVTSLNASDDQEVAVEIFKKYNSVCLPVVDSKNTLVGIVTFDDIMDVQEEESTEDMQKMAAMSVSEQGYFSMGMLAMIRKRLPWLGMLLVAETLAVLVLKGFEQWLAVLAMFMPLINATAGNTGSQVATLMIRGFALTDIQSRDWWRVFSREFFRGLFMGCLLAGLVGVIVLIVGTNPDAAIAVSPHQAAIAAAMAMIVAVTLANLIGSMLPFFFHTVGVDPAVTSGPFISVLMDVSSILIFFTTASMVIRLLR
jgi:magnesium transporter